MIWQPGRTIADIEKECILDALKFYGGNKTKTAQALGIAVRTVDYKLAEYAAAAKPPEKIKAK